MQLKRVKWYLFGKNLEQPTHGLTRVEPVMMTDNYLKLARANLERLYSNLPDALERRLPGRKIGPAYSFPAFGRECVISPHGITLGGVEPSGVIGILLSLYALNAQPDPPILEPLRAFKEFPDSAPYVGAFATHTQQALVPAVSRLKAHRQLIVEQLAGQAAPASVGGDFAFVVRPLPKIFLCYICYEADDDFPASVVCLFSSNADRFMPLDGLADVGEYTAKAILEILG